MKILFRTGIYDIILVIHSEACTGHDEGIPQFNPSDFKRCRSQVRLYQIGKHQIG